MITHQAIAQHRCPNGPVARVPAAAVWQPLAAARRFGPCAAPRIPEEGSAR